MATNVCRLLALCASCVLTVSLDALAQSSANGTVRGYVRDQHGAVLSGARVTAQSATVSVPLSTTTDARGGYRLVEVPPADYTISAEYQGFSRAQVAVVMRAGLNLAVDLAMSISGQAESVTVKREVPIVETKTAVQALNVDGDLQRGLPLSTSNHWSNFMALAPGVTYNQSARRPADSFYLRGSGFSSHVIQVDGADMASAVQNSPLFLTLPNELIADVQVKAGGVDASSPIGVGAVMNVATKSGSNQLQGATSFSLQRKNWSSNNNPGGTSEALNAVMPEVGVGGPIRQSRAWFFGAYRYERFETDVARSSAQIATLKAVDPRFEPFDALISGHYAFGKGTVQLSPSHRVEIFSISSPQKSASAGETQTSVPAITTTGGRRNLAAGVSSVWGPRLITKAGLNYNNLGSVTVPTNDEPSASVSSQTTLSGGRRLGIDTIVSMGGTGRTLMAPYSKVTAYVDATYFHTGLAGEHELRTGAYIQPRNHIEQTYDFGANRIDSESYVLRDAQDPTKGMVLFARRLLDLDSDQFTVGLTDTRDAAFYLQEAWRVSDGLTISAGLRADLIKRVDKLFNVVTQDSASIGPRVGANWALTDDRTRVVRASWGRVHDVVPAISGSAGQHNPAARDFYDTDLDGTLDAVFVTPEVTALAADRLVDVKRVQPFVDEWLAGFRQAFRGRLSIDINVVRRAYKSRTAQVEQNGVYDNGVFSGYRDERFLQLYLITNNRWNWPVYYDIDCQVIKDTSHLRVIGSYTRAWRHLAGTWQPNDPASFIQPDAFDNDKSFGGVTTGPSGYQGTLEFSPTWQDHILRLGLLYRGPWNMTVASNYSLQSGMFSGPIITILPGPDRSFGPPTVTLSNGRIASNPLATTSRFAYATRGDGQLKLDALHLLNLRVGRAFATRGNQRLELAAELFNVPNADSDNGWQNGANTLGNVNFGKTSLRQPPRSVRLTARLTF